MNKFAVVVAALLLLSVGSEIRADDEPERIDFDIYRNNHQMAVWVDLSSVITSKRVSQMKDGIDTALEYQLTLFRPRRLWGTHKLQQCRGVYQIGHRLITGEYFVSDLTSSPLVQRHFLSLGELHRFLSDSVNINLADIDSLDHSHHYFIQMMVTCVSLTSLNLSDSPDSSDSGPSAFKWLFKEFLDLTNFGRQHYSFESRPFSLTELTSER